MELSPEGQGHKARSAWAGERWVLAGPLALVLARACALRERGIRVAAAIPGPLDRAAIRALVAAGVEGLHATLHAADAAAHEFLAGSPGALRGAVDSLRAARAERLPAVVTTPLSRSNTRVLAGLPGLLADAEVAAWRVRVRPGAEGQTPRLSVALPFALQAIAAAARIGVPTAIEGAPHCLLGPLRGRAAPGPAWAFAPVCGGCPARGDCPGVDAEYLRRFAGDELSPRALRPAEKVALSDMFLTTWREVEVGDAPEAA